jgi:hypothetical protein
LVSKGRIEASCCEASGSPGPLQTGLFEDKQRRKSPVGWSKTASARGWKMESLPAVCELALVRPLPVWVRPLPDRVFWVREDQQASLAESRSRPAAGQGLEPSGCYGQTARSAGVRQMGTGLELALVYWRPDWRAGQKMEI